MSGGRRKVRVVGGLKALKRVLEDYLKELYEYNTRLRGTGFYLKPVHMVVKKGPFGTRKVYYYFGRYWWRIEYAGKKGRTSRVRWRYLGREKPRELSHLPDPPRHPLEGFRCEVVGEDVLLDFETYERFKWVFEGFEVVELDEEPSPQPSPREDRGGRH